MYDELKEGFKFVDTLKKISECKSKIALENLKKAIDRRIEELNAHKRSIHYMNEKQRILDLIDRGVDNTVDRQYVILSALKYLIKLEK